MKFFLFLYPQLATISAVRSPVALAAAAAAAADDDDDDAEVEDGIGVERLSAVDVLVFASVLGFDLWSNRQKTNNLL